ncbi:MAG: rhomboid family intramembrane serine protease [Dehalococcoidia bacterium]
MIPIGDSPRSRSTPWVTYAFIAANVAVFVYTLMLSNALPLSRVEAQRDYEDQVTTVCSGFEQTAPTETDRFFCRWSFQPHEFFRAAQGEETLPGYPGQPRLEVLLSIIASIFIHGGWLHIGGNMLFLWVFGDNVEDRLGHFGFLLFYLAAGVAAALTQGFVDPESLVPTVGASGAVAGVLGAYLVYFPKATVTTLIPFFPFFLPLPIPAVIMIGLWFVQNLLSGIATLGAVGTADSGVAFFAHIGGLVFGAATVFLFFRRRGRRRSLSVP